MNGCGPTRRETHEFEHVNFILYATTGTSRLCSHSGGRLLLLVDREQYVIVSMKLFKALYELWNESDARLPS